MATPHQFAGKVPPLRLGVAALATLAACSAESPDADAMELANMWHGYVVPKSHPKTFVSTFDSYCTDRSGDFRSLDRRLRAASYVPTKSTSGKAVRLYVVDDRRPAVAVGRRSCTVYARSRTGQTDRVGRYVSETFPEARPADPGQFGRDIEQAWLINGGIVATMRKFDADNKTSFALIRYRHGD